MPPRRRSVARRPVLPADRKKKKRKLKKTLDSYFLKVLRSRDPYTQFSKGAVSMMNGILLYAFGRILTILKSRNESLLLE